jgi:hypothetical protein
MMRTILRNNSLSVVMFGLFLLCLSGHSLAGYSAYNDDQRAHQQAPLRYARYLLSSHFWASVFENWESEFLQMAVYVLATVCCFQRGSAESKDPETLEEVDEGPAPASTRSAGPRAGAQGGARAHALCPFSLPGVSRAVRAVLSRPCREWDAPL